MSLWFSTAVAAVLALLALSRGVQTPTVAYIAAAVAGGAAAS
jgi:hypothetical protein